MEGRHSLQTRCVLGSWSALTWCQMFCELQNDIKLVLSLTVQYMCIKADSLVGVTELYSSFICTFIWCA
jgi:hypothetical protein